MTNPFKEMRNCRNCGTQFECYVTAPKLACSHACAAGSRKNTHRLIHTSEYSAWRDMKARCQRQTHKDYKSYGARGITVCERWQHFKNFFDDLGPKPGKDYSIERVNNHGNYEPSNCKWATRSEQARNRRPWHEWEYREDATCANKPSSSRALQHSKCD